MIAQRVREPTTDVSSTDPAPFRPAALDRALSRLPEFRHLDAAVEPLPGGLTNAIYKVTSPSGRSVVARVSSAKSALLAIDRFAECNNSVAAAQSGSGPRVVLCDPAEGVSIVDWIDGRTLTDAELRESAQLERVAANCRRLHAGARFANDFDMFDIQHRYLDVVTQHGFRLPPRYLDFAPQARAIAAALAVHPHPTVPCHNDLLAANIMDTGDRIWFIDYEYSGNNDPYFELGNIWSEAALPEDALADLVRAYFGAASPAQLARAHLWALMAKYGWTLWAAIQNGAGGADFDFWSWGMEKYERAVAEFDGPAFARWIEDVQQPN